MIADSNALRDPSLKDYFLRSRKNGILLADTTLIEMWKRSALFTSKNSLLIASQFLDRVFVLKKTHEVLELDITNEEQANLLIDYQATVELRAVCHDLMTLPEPPLLRSFMAEKEEMAKHYISELHVQTTDLEAALVDVTKQFKPDQIKQLRTGEGVTEQTKRILFQLWRDTTAQFIVDNGVPHHEKGTLFKDVLGQLPARYSLCMLIYYVLWVQKGRQTGQQHLRLNDIIDMQIAAMSTYFNGMLSRDALAFNTSRAVRAVLANHGAFVGKDWMIEQAQT
ncbi:hypothetical protein [Erythrobacter sp. QSSC1-22B]|uniref:hypothetical protein n=1 Tax=Erythrobacter sp. QSSC1-22B TaxID=1860125 RepID=UPI001F2E448A|nr:hypothetical protein [Erythrobacter sp. QSSC1-22B]